MYSPNGKIFNIIYQTQHKSQHIDYLRHINILSTNVLFLLLENWLKISEAHKNSVYLRY